MPHSLKNRFESFEDGQNHRVSPYELSVADYLLIIKANAESFRSERFKRLEAIW